MVSVNLQKKDNGGWTGTIDIPMQNAKGLPLSNIVIEAKSVSFAIAAIPGSPTFQGTLSEDSNSISGDFTQGLGKFMFKLSRSQGGQPAPLRRPQEPSAPLPYQAVDVAFENKGAGVKLAGTLTLPRVAGPVAAVVLITGSEPKTVTNRLPVISRFLFSRIT